MFVGYGKNKVLLDNGNFGAHCKRRDRMSGNRSEQKEKLKRMFPVLFVQLKCLSQVHPGEFFYLGQKSFLFSVFQGFQLMLEGRGAQSNKLDME